MGEAAAVGGSIPAWAGETDAAALVARKWKVYPRVGGGNIALVVFATLIGGLSPRGRGKLPEPPIVSALHRSIPAWAGETV